MTLQRRLRWTYGAVDVTTDQPMPPWVPGTKGEGVSTRMADAGLAVEEKRRDELLDLILRFRESEWPDVYALVSHLQRGGTATLFLESTDPSGVQVYGVRPAFGEKVAPRRTQNGDLMELPITVRKAAASPTVWTEEYFEGGGGGGGGGAGLTRDTQGLLAAHYALAGGGGDNPWSAGDFTGPDIQISVQGTSGRIRLEATTGNRYAIYDPLTSRSKVFMQSYSLLVSNGQGAPVKLLAHVQDVAVDAHDIGAQMFASIGRWDGTSLDEIAGVNEQENGSGAGGTLNVVPDKNSGTLYRFNLFADGLFSEMYDFDADIVGPNDNQDVHGSGQVGLGTTGANQVEHQYWVVMADKDVVVSGLPTGATVELLDQADTVLATAAEDGAGGATIDVHAERLNFEATKNPVKLVVKDSGGTELASITPTTGVRAGVWGGDTYTFTPA